MMWRLAYYLAPSVALVVLAIVALVGGDMQSAGVCALFGVLLAGRGVL